MASLSRMMKKAASSVITVANRTPGRYYTSAILIAPLKTSTINTSTNLFRQIFRTTSIPTYHYFCALSNTRSNFYDTLLRDIESAIDCAVEELDDLEVTEIPSEFPFKIDDNPEEKFVTLTRKYQDEEIKLTVRKLDPSSNSDYEDEDSSGDYGDEEIGPRRVELDVIDTKKNGSTLKLNCMLDADYANWIIFNSVAVKNPNDPHEDTAHEGLDFSKLSWEVHNSLHTYLVDRGIVPSTIKFLNEYMVNKKLKAEIAFLKKFKEMIAEKCFFKKRSDSIIKMEG